jgi:hypothetical protein
MTLKEVDYINKSLIISDIELFQLVLFNDYACKVLLFEFKGELDFLINTITDGGNLIIKKGLTKQEYKV